MIENYILIYFVNIDTKIFIKIDKINPNQIQEYIKTLTIIFSRLHPKDARMFQYIKMYINKCIPQNSEK